MSVEKSGDALPLLPREEWQRVVVQWNQTAAPYPHDRCLHELVAEQAARTPDATALVDTDERLSYRQLDQLANQLAHFLRLRNIGPETLVGLYVPRGIESIIGILGILKAGGAYVPLDPALPADRLQWMLQDTGATLVLTHSTLSEQLARLGVLAICLDQRTDFADQPAELPPPSGVCADQLAYVIYTSGSTGRPKGVAVEHRSACNMVVGWIQHENIRPSTRVLQCSSLSFDVSVSEIFETLIAGAELHLAPQEQLYPGPDLMRLLRERRIQMVSLTPSALSVLSDAELPELQTIYMGGEVCPSDLRERWARGRRLWNVYGPTEATVSTTAWLCCAGENPCIGRPLPNYQVYVLDADLQPVPVGVAAELFIGGLGVARGYINERELTAQRFVPSPFRSGRLYRTGDLARWRDDGQLEFLGRADEQIKLRGYRIELGEIESVLQSHPGVASCVVLLREDAPGDKRLCAYVVPQSGHTSSSHGLRKFLGNKLPDYMLPAAFVFLDALPLIPSGKVDRRALPAPTHQSRDEESAAPRTQTEQLLAEVFAAVLNLDRVGVHEDFFALGGHSLLGTQALSRIRSALSVELPLRCLFESPTVAALADVVTQLGGTAAALKALPIPVARRTGPLPLSFAQQRLWLIDQMEPGRAVYNLPAAMRLHGPLNLAALRRALTGIAERHESLRTRFSSEQGQPVQLIELAPRLWPLPVIDVRAPADAEVEDEVRRQMQIEVHTPFDLQKGPLWRTTLLQLAKDHHVLLLTMHHIVSDGWSLGVLVQELGALYSAAVHDQPDPLPALAVQLADVAAWQRESLQGDLLQRELSYWQKQLADCQPLELPTDHKRPARFSHRGSSRSFVIPAPLAAALKDLAQQQGVTLFMLLLSAFKVLLSRYSRQHDICIGSPIANRTRSELEPLIGFFVNTLVLRTSLADNPRFVELLARVKTVCLEAYAHQSIPFDRLVEELQVPRDLSRNPLFQVMFVLQNAPMGELQLEGLEGIVVPGAVETAMFDLTLSLEGAPDGSLGGGIEYATDLYEAATVQRMVGHYLELLSGGAAAPQTRIAELPLLTAAERQEILVQWNGTRTNFPTDRCLHELFAEQARKTPAAIAVVCDEHTLTYRELEVRANQLAHLLQSLGVGPEVRVGIYLERTIELPVTMLGILKAGGAYVALEPSAPADRLRFMREDADARLLVCCGQTLDWLDPTAACTVVDLADPQTLQQLAAQPHTAPPSAATARSLAYIIYTSGSTGIPKGVATEHRAVINFVYNHRERTFGGGPLAVAMVAPTIFDGSVAQTFGALIDGHTLYIVNEQTRQDGEALLRFLRHHRIELCDCSPALLGLLVAAGLPTAEGLRLHTLVCAGEALPTALLRTLYAPGKAAGLRVLNVYGPTECCIDTTAMHIDVQHIPGTVTAPLGRPLDNTRLYVLDAARQPVPIGVSGEICIAGAGVSRGYVNRPELTAEKFIADPFSDDPAARMYQTGDLARWLPNGNLEFLGRIDFQVKLRGFRIELGEIESVLGSHPDVHACVVLLREDTPGDKRLVAYVVPRAGSTPGIASLRQSLGSKLPDYMLPAAFVVLDALPITSNGKVDRRALPPPAQQTTTEEWLAPRTPVEQVLANVFAQVLHLERVGVHQGFFSLGGHSLLATQAISRIRSALGLELPLRALFETPTVAALAETVVALRGASPLLADAIVPATRAGDLPLSFGQQRLWFLDQMEPGSPVYNISVAMQLRGQLNPDALRHAFTRTVVRHEALRTRFDAFHGQPVQLIDPAPDAWPLPLVDLSGRPESEREEEVARRTQAEARTPFNLRHGPLLRTSLLRLSQDHHVLLLTMHHIVSDGWSLGVLMRELSALYGAFVTNQADPLPVLPVQIADVAVWERAALQREALQRDLFYWQKQLAGSQPLDLPTDRKRPPLFSYRGHRLPLHIAPALAAALKDLAQQQGVTLFMLLLSAFKVLLARYSRQRDVCIGSPIANRTRSELEPLIGFFVNTLVLRTSLADNPRFVELLARVKLVCLEAYAHQSIPFERLVEELHVQRDLSRNPLFQVMFILQNAPMGGLQLPGIAVIEVDTEGESAKFDLMLSLTESADGSLSGGIEYATDLFDASTVVRMGSHLEQLLEGAAADPQARIGELPLLTDAEWQQLGVQWNQTQTDFPQQSIQQLFEAQAARSPDAVALMDHEKQLSYRELNERANQLAHHLKSLGVGPEVVVGLCRERSLDAVVGLLGIVKAGGAFLALDPSYPAERLQFMLEDSAAPVLLTRKGLHVSLLKRPRHTVFIEADRPIIAQGSAANPVSVAVRDPVMYLIYTSGSTGTPKGVLGLQRGALNRMHWMWSTYPFAPGEVCCQKTSLSFVDAIWEIFGPLLQGVPSVILSDQEVKDPDLLVSRLAAQRVSRIVLVPSLLGAILSTQEDLAQRLPHLRYWITSGETLPLELAHRFVERVPSGQLLNLYGSSEVAADATWYSWEADAARPSVPIGRPIANMQVYILDPALQPVPVGVPGEIHLGGDGLGRGYLNRPELTAQKFIRNPFSSDPASRLYNTGDLGRYLADGNIEFLGRIDHQVKLRGFRIELGEIESVLAAHPAVNTCAVLLREDNPGNPCLTAYVVLHQGAQGDMNGLRSHLEAKLPNYMIPSAFLFLNQLPLNANGKVDRRALPAARVGRGFAGDSYLAPRDQLELQLTQIWESVLGVYPVGVRDNFFTIGGHSLLAVRLLTQLQEKLGYRLPLTTLFQEATVERLAHQLVQQQSHAPDARPPQRMLVPIQPAGSNPPLFCPHAGTGTATFYAALARHLGPEQPFYAFQARGLDGVEAPHRTLEEMAGAYCEQLRVIQPAGPYFLGGFCFGGLIAFEMAHQLQRAGHEVALIAMLSASTHPFRFDIEEDDWLVGLGLDLGLFDSAADIEQLQPDAQLRHLVRLAQQADLVPSWFGVADLRHWVQVHKAIVQAGDHYVRRPLTQRIVLFRTTTPFSTADGQTAQSDLTYGWDQLSQQPVEVCEVPGTHVTLFKEPHVRTLAERLHSYLSGNQVLP